MGGPSVKIFVDTDTGSETIEMPTKTFGTSATLALNRVGRDATIALINKKLNLIAKAFKALSLTDNFAGFVFLCDACVSDIKKAIEANMESELTVKNFMPECEIDFIVKCLKTARLEIFKQYPMYRAQLLSKDDTIIAESNTMIPATDFDFLKGFTVGYKNLIVSKLSDSRYPNMYIKFIEVKYYRAEDINCIGYVIMDLINQSHKIEDSKGYRAKVDVEEDDEYLLEKITDDIVKEEERDDEDDCLYC